MKTIVITGSTSGIGKALVKHFSCNNTVFAGYRKEEYAKELESLDAIPFYIDMTDGASIRRAAVYIKSRTKRIDTLINAAGCVVAGAAETLDIERIREQFEVNTFSHLEFSQNLLDLLEGGRIINISSMASFGIFPFISPYCASKRALDILFNSMAVETGRDIKIVSVKPGVIATPLWQKSIEANKSSIEKAAGFEDEMRFMIKNAEENQVKGLDVSRVVDLIAHINALNEPKSSYTIGFDAKIAEIVSHLPQNWINNLVKYNLNRRVNYEKR